MRRVAFTLPLVLLVGFLWWNFPTVARVKLEGCSPERAEEMKRLILPHIKGRTIFEVSIRRVARALLSHPWVRSCEIWRHWPDGLEVKVQERRIVALLQQKGRLWCLDQDGMPFKPWERDDPWNLPVVSGLGAGELERAQDLVSLIMALQDHPLFKRYGVAEIYWGGERGAVVVTEEEGIFIYMGKEGWSQKLKRLTWVWRYLKERGLEARYFLCEGPDRIVVGLRRGEHG